MKTNRRSINSILTITAGAIPVALLLLATAGCGSTKVSAHTTTNASVGQQLMDLKKAREQNLIDDKEYDKLREAIIEKNE